MLPSSSSIVSFTTPPVEMTSRAIADAPRSTENAVRNDRPRTQHPKPSHIDAPRQSEFNEALAHDNLRADHHLAAIHRPDHRAIPTQIVAAIFAIGLSSGGPLLFSTGSQAQTVQSVPPHSGACWGGVGKTGQLLVHGWISLSKATGSKRAHISLTRARAPAGVLVSATNCRCVAGEQYV